MSATLNSLEEGYNKNAINSLVGYCSLHLFEPLIYSVVSAR